MDQELKTYLEAMEGRILERVRGYINKSDALFVTNKIVDRHEIQLDDHHQWLRGQTTTLAQHKEWLEQHNAAMQDHEKWLRDHEEAIRRHEVWKDQHEEAMRQLDRKLDRIADMILKGRSPNGKGRGNGGGRKPRG